MYCGFSDGNMCEMTHCSRSGIDWRMEKKAAGGPSSDHTSGSEPGKISKWLRVFSSLSKHNTDMSILYVHWKRFGCCCNSYSPHWAWCYPLWMWLHCKKGGSSQPSFCIKMHPKLQPKIEAVNFVPCFLEGRNNKSNHRWFPHTYRDVSSSLRQTSKIPNLFFKPFHLFSAKCLMKQRLQTQLEICLYPSGFSCQ